MKLFKLSVLLGFIGCATMSANAALTLNWSYGGNLAIPIPSVQVGWVVQLYQDVSANTVLSSITSFDASDFPLGGAANASDDQILGSFQTTVGIAKSTYSFLTSTSADAIAGARVYTVLFNNTVMSSATQAWIIDTTPTTLISAGIAAYTPNATASTVGYGPLTVAVVPEPSSVALIGIGLAAIALRRRFSK